MRKLKVVFCGLVLMGATHSARVLADDYQYLMVDYSSVEQSHPLSTLQKLTFSDGKMNVINADGTSSSYSLSTLEKLYFSATATAIASTASQAKGISYSPAEQCIVAAGLAGTQLKVYTAGGSIAKQAGLTSDSQHVSVADLPHGIYIVKVSSQTIKIAK
jgi:hypothetical protein